MPKSLSVIATLFLPIILIACYLTDTFSLKTYISTLSMKELTIYSSAKDNQTQKTIKAKLKYTVADDEGERTKGLMFVKSLPKNQGMLFVFPDEEPRSFWMKNTYIPLDMIFFDSTFKIQNIVKHAKPFDTTPTEPSEPCKYVLEVHAGFVDENGVVVGDEVGF